MRAPPTSSGAAPVATRNAQPRAPSRGCPPRRGRTTVWHARDDSAHHPIRPGTSDGVVARCRRGVEWKSCTAGSGRACTTAGAGVTKGVCCCLGVVSAVAVTEEASAPRTTDSLTMVFSSRRRRSMGQPSGRGRISRLARKNELDFDRVYAKMGMRLSRYIGSAKAGASAGLEELTRVWAVAWWVYRCRGSAASLRQGSRSQRSRHRVGALPRPHPRKRWVGSFPAVCSPHQKPRLPEAFSDARVDHTAACSLVSKSRTANESRVERKTHTILLRSSANMDPLRVHEEKG